uniref:Uncharacterized protein n=1 Tax=Panagrolaimus superbus TaxID=310955 RepID=A0A914YLF3_9BILA
MKKLLAVVLLLFSITDARFPGAGIGGGCLITLRTLTGGLKRAASNTPKLVKYRPLAGSQSSLTSAGRGSVSSGSSAASIGSVPGIGYRASLKIAAEATLFELLIHAAIDENALLRKAYRELKSWIVGTTEENNNNNGIR